MLIISRTPYNSHTYSFAISYPFTSFNVYYIILLPLFTVASLQTVQVKTQTKPSLLLVIQNEAICWSLFILMADLSP